MNQFSNRVYWDGLIRSIRMNRHKLIIETVLLVLTLVLVQERPEAHPMPNTVVELSVTDHLVSGVARMPYTALEDATKRTLKGIEAGFIRDYFQGHVGATSKHGSWKTTILKIDVVQDQDRTTSSYQEVVVHFTLTPPHSEDIRYFTLDYDAIIHQVITHKILVFVKYDWEKGMVQGGEPRPVGYISLDVPSGKIYPLVIDLEQGSWLEGTKAMFAYGMKHIRLGLDHLLFLLTLLMVAPLMAVNRKWSDFQGFRYTLTRFLKISLAFTIGHSVTLLIGSFNLLPVRSQYIEVLIAVSILISAIHNIRPLFPNREVGIAGGFGLIHGLAFSNSLASVQLGWQARLLSILSFNLGIETMQLIIMAAFFPLLITSKWKFYPAVRVLLAIITSVIALAWIAERVSSHENSITAVVNSFL